MQLADMMPGAAPRVQNQNAHASSIPQRSQARQLPSQRPSCCAAILSRHATTATHRATCSVPEQRCCESVALPVAQTGHRIAAVPERSKERVRTGGVAVTTLSVAAATGRTRTGSGRGRRLRRRAHWTRPSVTFFSWCDQLHGR
eukprot:6184023-Pleurochrysis_carterae.AAC.1